MTRVKVCGVTRPEDAERCVELGVWAIGLNFAPESPRRLSIPPAAEISNLVRRRIEVAGIFVNADLGRIVEVARATELTLVQLHGDEGPAFCAEAARRTGCRVVKAFRVATAGDVAAARPYRTDFHLFDARRPDRHGGTGETFDLDLLRGRGTDVPLILAGGMRPDNVAEAVARVRPWAVDVASGVESEPGVKDPELVERFVAAAHGAEARA